MAGVDKVQANIGEFTNGVVKKLWDDGNAPETISYSGKPRNHIKDCDAAIQFVSEKMDATAAG